MYYRQACGYLRLPVICKTAILTVVIHLLLGENVFRRGEELRRILAGRECERLDGAEVEERDLPGLLAGQTLFASEQVIAITHLSQNKPVWAALEPWITKLDDTTTLILIETKLDKRTKTYKLLQKHAAVTLCEPWTERQAAQAEKWLVVYTKQQSVQLTPALASDMVQRAIRPSEIDEKPIIDQQLLATVVAQLRPLAGEVSERDIQATMPQATFENIFQLFERALKGDGTGVRTMTAHLAQTQDGHRAMALLASQAANLAVLALADGMPTDEVAQEIGVHPFALRQLAPLAHEMNRQQIQAVVRVMTEADERLKHGVAEPWTLIDVTLTTIAAQR